MAYIGSAEDSRRIAKQNEEREKSRQVFSLPSFAKNLLQEALGRATETDALDLSCYCRKEFEERKQKGEANVDGAGLRQFGAGSTDVRLIDGFEATTSEQH